MHSRSSSVNERGVERSLHNTAHIYTIYIPIWDVNKEKTDVRERTNDQRNKSYFIINIYKHNVNETSNNNITKFIDAQHIYFEPLLYIIFLRSS